MDNNEKEIIEKIIDDLRQSILEGEIKFIGSEDFPYGSCGNASDLLFNVLHSKGFKQIEKKVNMWFKDKSHSWLIYKGYILDITIDQFKEGNCLDFITEEKTSEFHRKYKKL